MNFFLRAALLASLIGTAAAQTPLVPAKTWSFPEIPPGPYTDHLAYDAQGGRIFITAQSEKAVVAIDLKTGKSLHTISGFGNPHSVLFDPKTQRLFVADGGDGALKVYSGKDYSPVKRVPLLKDADGFSYDDKTRLLYVNNGGEEADKPYEVISIVDVDSLEVKGEIRLDTDKLEATHLSPDGATIFADLPDKNVVAVIDVKERKVRAMWPLGDARFPMALAADDANGLLFAGTRDTDVHGSIVVMSTADGSLKARLPIGGWVDQLDWDTARKRLYATCGTGQVFTYEQQPDGSFKELSQTDTAVLAKTSLFVPSLDQLFVAVPHLGDSDYRVMIFNLSPAKGDSNSK